MNIYDTRSIYCSECGKFMGEIDHDAVVTLPKCGTCVSPLPKEIVSPISKKTQDS